MINSILKDIKDMLGIDDSSTAFDNEILAGINSAFATLSQLGVTGANGIYVVDDSSSWSDISNDNNIIRYIRNYVYLKTKIQFDPPSNSFLESALSEQIKELEFRINIDNDKD